MDIVGPIPRSSSNNRYLLVMMYHLTHYPEVVAMPDQTAKTVAKAYLTAIIARWGVPDKMLTDQRSNFLSNLMKKLHQKLGSATLVTTAYHLQTNGMVERLNRTLKDVINKPGLTADQSNWEGNVLWTVASYRWSIHAYIKDLPHHLMTLTDPVLPQDTQVYDSPQRDQWET